MEDDARRWRMLALVGAVLILSMSTWFAATAILPQLQAAFGLSPSAASWLTNAVQLGFVVFALAASVIGLADRYAPRAIISLASLGAAASTLVMVWAPSPAVLFAARFATGMALAGVYPTALRVIASWFVRGRGMAMGIAIAALTLGSATPYCLRAVGARLPWSGVVVAASLAAALAAALASRLHGGPHAPPPRPVSLGRIAAVVRDRPLLLANLGYFGHMWELYALWGWFLAYATSAPAHRGLPVSPALLTFCVVGIGAAGCLLGGYAADRVGRTATTMAAMAVSGCCALCIGLTFDGPSWMFATIAIVWGIAVIADSAQFSAMASELADPESIGAALAFQIGVGFALTIVSIRLVPLLAAAVGWQWTFAMLAPGPFAGVAAMLALRRMPRAARIAGGLR